MVRFGLMVLALTVVAGQANAQETTQYRYDALGRLAGSTVSGGINNGTETTIDYDSAGNRRQYKVTGAPNLPQAGARVVVVPLNGFTVIPLPSSTF